MVYRKLSIKIIFVFLTFVFISSSVAQEISIEEKLNKINQASQESLGVSLLALAYLVKASPNSYLPLWYLEKSGDINTIYELEKAGYVKVIKRNGLPNGSQPNEIFVNIQPIYKGKEIQQYLIALKKNKTDT